MKILAFGATGFVGKHLVPHLVDGGHQVTVAARSGKAGFPPAVRVIKADPMTPGQWQDSVTDYDAVLNLAGTPISTRWTEAGKQSILESRMFSTRNIVDALEKSPGKTFLCANAVGFYGDCGDRLCAEDSHRGTGFLAEVAQAWQDEALRASESGHRVVIPRLAVVLGDGGALGKMVPPFSFGLGGRLGSGKQWFPWVHVQDVVRIMRFLLESPQASGIYNACAPHPVTNAEFTSALGRALHRPAVLPVPAFVLRLALGEAADMLLGGQRCLPQKLQSLGFRFQYLDLDRALAQIIPALKTSKHSD
ncbi:MAG: TIGR01777 family protein [Desulfovibrionales bacterium]|nr:TIGR01777 family protein [Desulfovibrionales bacterium]